MMRWEEVLFWTVIGVLVVVGLIDYGIHTYFKRKREFIARLTSGEETDKR